MSEWVHTGVEEEDHTQHHELHPWRSHTRFTYGVHIWGLEGLRAGPSGDGHVMRQGSSWILPSLHIQSEPAFAKSAVWVQQRRRSAGWQKRPLSSYLQVTARGARSGEVASAYGPRSGEAVREACEPHMSSYTQNIGWMIICTETNTTANMTQKYPKRVVSPLKITNGVLAPSSAPTVSASAITHEKSSASDVISTLKLTLLHLTVCAAQGSVSALGGGVERAAVPTTVLRCCARRGAAVQCEEASTCAQHPSPRAIAT